MITTLLLVSMAIILAAGVLALSGLIQPNAAWRRFSLLLMLPGLAGIIVASVWVMAGDLQVLIPLF
ncbi:MAG: hypothetical protein WCS64_05200, partial [Dehalococcoidales bacterium]